MASLQTLSLYACPNVRSFGYQESKDLYKSCTIIEVVGSLLWLNNIAGAIDFRVIVDVQSRTNLA